MRKGDKVLSVGWEWGKQRGYEEKPGTIIRGKAPVFEVRWQDGHETLSSVDELKPA